MNESAPANPAFDALNATPEGGGPKLRLGLDQQALNSLVESPPARVEGSAEALSGKYFTAADAYLKATDKRLADLEDQWKNLDENTRSYMTGLDKLRHISPKDYDRVTGRILAKLLLEGSVEQISQGTGAVSNLQLNEKLVEAQAVWENLTPRARAQVARGLRDMATRGDFVSSALVKLEDWTLNETIGKSSKDDFQSVMANTAGLLRSSANEFGIEQVANGTKKVIVELETQIGRESGALFTRMEEGIKALEASITILSANPDKQLRIQEGLDQIKQAQQTFGETTFEAAGEKWDNGYVKMLSEAIKAADSICLETDKIVKSAGVRGRIAGQAVEVAEVKAVHKGGLPEEQVVKLLAGYEIARDLGILEHDLRLRIGRVVDWDFNDLIQRVPIISGLKQAREVFRERTNEELLVVSALARGEAGTHIRENLDAFLSSAASVEERAEALRALKSCGANVDLRMLAEYRGDIAALAEATVPKKGLTPEMRTAWEEMHTIAEELNQALNAEAPQDLVVNEEITRGIGDFTTEALKTQMESVGLKLDDVDVPNLFSQEGWLKFITQNHGRWTTLLRRTVLAPIYLRRSPSRLMGVENGDGGPLLKGATMEMAKGLSAVSELAESDQPLLTALRRARVSGGLGGQTALFLVRAGMGEAGERLRAGLRLRNRDVTGMWREMAQFRLVNAMKPETALAYVAGGTAAVVAGTELYNAIAPVAINFIHQQGIDSLASLNSHLGPDQAALDAANDRLNDLRQTHVGPTDVQGPLPPENGMISAEGSKAANNLLAKMLKEAQQAAQNAQNLVTNDTVQIAQTQERVGWAAKLKDTWQQVHLDPIQIVTRGALTGTTAAMFIEAGKYAIRRAVSPRRTTR